jgi:hypothetical protein
MKIVITEEKLKEAIEYAIAERGLVDNILRNNIETYIKAGSITADSQAERTVCPDCGDMGWIYSDNNEKRRTCPCHY